MKLTASKSFLYNNRRLLPGDDFETKKPIHGVLLIAAKKARERREPGKVSPPPASLARKVAPDDEISAARAEYQEKVGKRPFMGWDAETVRAKMAEAEAPEPVAETEPAVEADVEEAAEDAAS